MNRKHLLWSRAEPLPPTLKWIAPPAGPQGDLGGHRGIVRTSVMLIGKTLLMWTHGGSVWMWVLISVGWNLLDNLSHGWRKAKEMNVSEMSQRAFNVLAKGTLIDLKLSVWQRETLKITLSFSNHVHLWDLDHKEDWVPRIDALEQ